jgi:hypothetical protein
MPSPPERRRIPFLLILVIFAVVCFLFPRAAYEMRLAVMELRYGFLIFLLIGLFIWILLKLGPRDRR